jgi:hypothetical protein
MNLTNLRSVPIVHGRKPNERAIKIAESVLESLRKGDFVNIAIVAERLDGEPAMSVDFDASVPGEAMKMRGALGHLVAVIDKKMMGG